MKFNSCVIMSFLSLIFKNPFRNKSRAILAIVGIGIGIATIVVLGTITASLTQTMDDTIHVGGADFSVLSNESDSGTPFGTATIDEKWISKIKNISGVKHVEGIYLGMVPIDGYPNSMLIGINPNSDLSVMSMKVTKGRMIKNNSNEVLGGKLALEKMNKTIGDKIIVKGEEFLIVGAFETGDPARDSEFHASIENVQRLSNDAGRISIIYVLVDSGVDVKDVTKKIDDKYGDNLTTVSSVTDIEMMDEALNMVNAASWGTSLLAILIGGIGIINTMIMSVYERTREIGVLRAVGWKSRRILTMIMGESLILTLSSGIIGSAIGVLVIELLAGLGILGSIIPVYSIETFVQAFALAMVVGLIGGFYPAYRASRLPPTEALRYE